MKSARKRIFSAFLATAMLALCVPTIGIVTGAVAGTQKFNYNYDDKTSANYYGGNWDSKSENIKASNNLVSYTDGGTDKYLQFNAKKTDATAGGIATSGYLNKTDLNADVDQFTMEATFVQNDDPIGFRWRFSGTNNIKSYRQIMECTSAGDFYFINAASGYLLGNVKTETLHISYVFTAVKEYNGTDGAYSNGYYLVDVYVNGILKVGQAAFTNSTVDLLNPTSEYKIAVASFNFNTYSDLVNYDDDASNDITSPYDENGVLKCSLCLDNYTVTSGSVNPLKEENNHTLVLYAMGRTVPGMTVTRNVSGLVSAPVDPVEGVVTLPTIADGWYTNANLSGLPITTVSASLLSNGVPAAYTKAGPSILLDNDLSTNANGLTPSGGASYDRESGRINLLGYTHTNTDSNIDVAFGSTFKAGLTDNMTFTFSLSLERGTEEVPSFGVRLRTAGDNPEFYLINLSNTGVISFHGVTAATLPMNSKVQVTAVVTIENVYTDGTATGSNLTVEGFIDGVSFGVSDPISSSLITVNSGSLDLTYLQIQANKTTMGYATERLVYIDDVVFGTGNCEPISGETNPTVGAINPLSGASVRISNDAASSGLRFGFEVSREWYNRLDTLGDVTVGALIVPSDKIGGTALTAEALDAADIDYLDLITGGTWNSESTDTTACFWASIVSIRGENYARAFTAVGYVTVTYADSSTETFYSAPSDSRSVYEVSKNFAASGDFATAPAATQDRIESYLDSVVTLDATVSPVTLTGYTSPYTVTYAGGVITIEATSGSVENIKSILIGTSIYTRGWAINAEKTQLTANYAVE